MAWILATFAVVFVAGAGVYFQARREAPAVVGEDAPESKPAFVLREIVENEEKDDAPVYDPNSRRLSGDDFRFLPEPGDELEDRTPPPPAPVAGKDAPSAEPAVVEKVDAKVRRSFIAHTTRGVSGVPADRVVDVLCLFTTNYKNRYGGGDSRKIIKRIEEMFRESNQIYQKQNGKTVAVRMVGVVETDYLDSYLTVDLANLNQGKMKSVAGTPSHELRNRLGADMVALFGTKGGGGVSSGNPFFIVKRGHGIFTHECQHAFGWGHGEQLPNGGGDDVTKLGRTAPGRSAWMPKKVEDGKIWFEYRSR
jgi:hypothetical protein